MYESLKTLLLDMMKAPHDPPPAPSGAGSSVKTFRASPNYLKYQYCYFIITLAFFSVIFLVGGIAFLANESIIGFILAMLLEFLLAICGIAGFVLIRLEYDLRYYIVTDRSLRMRKGVWSILEQTLTYANIQNVQVEQGPVERIFGISTVAVETAGGGGSAPGQAGFSRNYHRAVLSGLDNAEAVRDLVIGYLKKQGHGSGLGDPDERKKSGGQLSAQEIQALRDILQEARMLRDSVISPK